MPFRIPELDAKVSVLICFRGYIPAYGRRYVEEDTDFPSTSQTNGWFGETAANGSTQHNAVFRAVENRIPLVHARTMA